jgi:hypothetical protein
MSRVERGEDTKHGGGSAQRLACSAGPLASGAPATSSTGVDGASSLVSCAATAASNTSTASSSALSTSDSDDACVVASSLVSPEASGPPDRATGGWTMACAAPDATGGVLIGRAPCVAHEDNLSRLISVAMSDFETPSAFAILRPLTPLACISRRRSSLAPTTLRGAP